MKRQIIASLVVWAWAALTFGSVKVGVFHDRERQVYGRRIMAALAETEGISATVFANVVELKHYDVVVFGVDDASNQPETWRESIVVYAGNGGGVVLLGNCCGRVRSREWRKQPSWRFRFDSLFPAVVSIGGKSKEIENVFISEPDHAVLRGMKADELAEWNSMELIAGPRGTVLARAGENGAGLIVAGTMGWGRIVGFGAGIAMGRTADAGERRILANAIRWACEPVSKSEAINADDQLLIQSAELEIIKEQLEIQRRTLRNRAALGI